jgi:hypothetical protein
MAIFQQKIVGSMAQHTKCDAAFTFRSEARKSQKLPPFLRRRGIGLTPRQLRAPVVVIGIPILGRGRTTSEARHAPFDWPPGYWHNGGDEHPMKLLAIVAGLSALIWLTAIGAVWFVPTPHRLSDTVRTALFQSPMGQPTTLRANADQRQPAGRWQPTPNKASASHGGSNASSAPSPNNLMTAASAVGPSAVQWFPDRD